jgi:glycosyltransferase involved in cell wall biosynthesis
VRQLLAAGVSVQAMILDHSSWLHQHGLPCPYTVIGRSSLKNPLTWFYVFKNIWRAKKNGVKVAHIFFNDASVICPPIFKLFGIKNIISRRDMGFWYNNLYRMILPLTGRCVDLVISNSQAVSQITQQVERLPTKKMHVIYNGFDRAPAAEKQISELENIAHDGGIMLGLVANIRPIKRIQDAIAALALLPQRNMLHLVVIGAGEPAELQALSHKLNVAGRVHFLGSRADVPDCLRYFSAGLLCSESEGFSNSIVEYQFAGLPVICSRTGGNPEAVETGETGWLYDVADVQALAKCIDELISNPEVAKSMGVQAKKVAAERYSVNKMLENHLAVYAELVGN